MQRYPLDPLVCRINKISFHHHWYGSCGLTQLASRRLGQIERAYQAGRAVAPGSADTTVLAAALRPALEAGLEKPVSAAATLELRTMLGGLDGEFDRGMLAAALAACRYV